MKLRRFNESLSENNNITLYRLTSGDHVNLKNPGKYYFSDEQNIDHNLLKSKKDKLFLITVETTEDNIDHEESEQESEASSNDSIKCITDPSRCEIISIIQYKNNNETS